MWERNAPIAENMPLLKLVVMALDVHRFELLIIRYHRRGEAEAFRKRRNENPPLDLLFILMGVIIRNLVIFSNQFFHPFQNLRIGFVHALGCDIKLQKAVHRRFARNEIEPMITLSLFPPIKGGTDIELNRDAFQIVVMAFAIMATAKLFSP